MTALRPSDESEGKELIDVVKVAFSGAVGAIGIAVSGGSDSMALLHLGACAASEIGVELHAVTIDHRLRPEAAAEASHVRDVCEALKVRHDTLAWDHGEISGNLSDQARRARYRLISEWARTQGVTHVALGHTADDQAETFLMELAREAGLDGLSGMRSRWTENGLTWLRPLLETPRQSLRDYLVRQAVAWKDDPTNEDQKYQRVRARRALKALSPLGISATTIASVAGHLADARRVLETAVADAKRPGAREDAGAIFLDHARFLLLDPELQRRLLIGALRCVSGAAYSPRSASIKRALGALVAGRRATLSGCLLSLKGGEACILREPKAVADHTTASDVPWDGRWLLNGPHAPGLVAKALGESGLDQCKGWRSVGLPRDVLIVSPAIWQDATLIAAPVAGMHHGWTATLLPERSFFAGSH